MNKARIDGAWERFWAGDYEDALRQFRKLDAAAKGSAEDNAEAVKGVIACLRRLERLDQAHVLVEEAFSRFGRNSKAVVGIWDELGWLHHLDKEPSKALSAFRQALAIDPDDLGALTGTVDSLRRLRRFAEVQRTVETALARSSENDLEFRAGIYCQSGWAYQSHRAFEQAAEAFENALAVEPGNLAATCGQIAALRCTRRFAEARRVVERALEGAADEGVRTAILGERAWLHFEQNRFEEAMEDCERVLQHNRDSESAHQGKIASLRMLRRYEEAAAAIDEACDYFAKPDGPGVGILAEFGWLLFEQRNFEKADELFCQALAREPDNVDLYFSRVEVLVQLKEFARAQSILEELCRQYPQDLVIRNQLGRLYARIRKLDEARQTFRAVLDADGENAEAFSGLGASEFLRARYRAAERNFRQARRYGTRVPLYCTNLAWALVRAQGGRPVSGIRRWLRRRTVEPLEEAAQLALESLDLQPKPAEKAEAYACLGVIAFKRDEIIDSRDYLRRSIAVDPTAGHYVDLGALYVQMGHLAEAEEQFEKALQLDPDNAQAHVECGILHLEREEFDGAAQCFRRALSLDKRHVEARRGLAVSLMELDDEAQAQRILREGVRIQPRETRWLLHLALSQLLVHIADEQNETALYYEAFKEVRNALRIRPKHPELYFQSGVVQFRLEDHKGALRQFRNCLKQDRNQFQAELNANRIEAFLESRRTTSNFLLAGGCAVATVALLTLVALIVPPLTAGLIEGIRPLGLADSDLVSLVRLLFVIMLGAVALPVFLPILSKIKLPWVEAELTEPEPKPPKEAISLGPKGEMAIKSSIVAGGSGHRFWY